MCSPFDAGEPIVAHSPIDPEAAAQYRAEAPGALLELLEMLPAGELVPARAVIALLGSSLSG